MSETTGPQRAAFAAMVKQGDSVLIDGVPRTGLRALLNDADCLAQYESRCIPRTADMPEDAVTFHKDEAGECWLSDQHPIGPLLTGWDDLAPGESGPLSRYIVDVE